MGDVIDDQDSRSNFPKASRRVPAYVALPVVLGCGLIGYALSLVAPLHPVPAPTTANRRAVEPSQLAAQPAANPADASGNAARDAPATVDQASSAQPDPSAQLEPPKQSSTAAIAPPIPGPSPNTVADDARATAPMRLGKSQPLAAQTEKQAPVVETGALERTSAPNPGQTPTSASVEPNSATEPIPGVTGAQEMRRKKFRRMYRRPRAAREPQGPAEKLWSWLRQ
jgi:hypothetical protein